MPSSERLPGRKAIKLQAKRLRQLMAEQNIALSHSQSLEWISKLWSYPDWNTFNAVLKASKSPMNVNVGSTVTGIYMGHRFDAKVLGLQSLGNDDAFSITLQFKEPIEVSEADSVTGQRYNVTRTIGLSGKTVQKNADGSPHLQIDLK